MSEQRRKCRLPRGVFIEARRIARSPSLAAQVAKRAFPPHIAARVQAAARGKSFAEHIDADGVVQRRPQWLRPWTSPRCCRIVAAAFILHRCRRRAGTRRTVGIGYGLIARVLQCSVSSVGATIHDVLGPVAERRGHRAGRLGRAYEGNCGYVPALEQAGALRVWQPPVSVVQDQDAGPRRPDGTRWAFVQVAWPDASGPPS